MWKREPCGVWKRRIDRRTGADSVAQLSSIGFPHLFRNWLFGSLAALAFASPTLAAPPKPDPALHAQALELLTKGIAFRTVIPGDQVPVYAEYLKGQLVKAGFKPDEVKIERVAGSATLTARYAGTDPKKKPIVIIDHMDVVEAKASDWTRDPFKPVVENGYVYGRGSLDDKFDVSMVVTVLAKLKREG